MILAKFVQTITHSRIQMNEVRYASHPSDFSHYDTQTIRKTFLMEELFVQDQITTTYSLYDRLIVGSAAPLTRDLTLPALPELKADFFLERRELGIINVGPSASITVDGIRYSLAYKEALYIGRGAKEVTFHPSGTGQTFFYFNSAPAHRPYPNQHIRHEDAETVVTGASETSNHRTIRKLMVGSVVKTCQLQMGLTELSPGSVWNTMPPHTHDRRMEAYFYFEIPDNHMVCHFMGQAEETRHVWMKNRQAVLSPPWSIHCGAGTSNYSFIWGMAGENLDYSDMDVIQPNQLR